MEKEIKKIGDSYYEITINAKGEEWSKEVEAAYTKLEKDVEIKGFRKGKAPKDMLRSKISTTDMFNEAINSFLDKTFPKIVEEEQLIIYDQPHFHVLKISNEEVSLQVHFVVAPTITLGQYKGIEVEVDKVLVVDEDVEERIKQLQEQHAELSLKEDGVVELGNTVTLDFEGFLDGEPFEGGKAEKYPLEIGSNTFIPGFEEQIVGLKVGDKKDVVVTFPENYTEELKGKEATFKILVHEIKEKVLPEIDDELALDANFDEVSNLEQLKEHYHNELMKEKEDAAKEEAFKKVIDQILENSELEVAESLIKKEADNRIERTKQELEQKGATYEGYLEHLNIDEKAFVYDVKVKAKESIKYAFAIMEIAKVENIEVTDEEIDEELNQFAMMYGQTLEQLKEALKDNLASFKQDKLFRKVLDFLRSENNL